MHAPAGDWGRVLYFDQLFHWQFTPLDQIMRFLLEPHVTECQNEKTRGTWDANVHHIHTNGTRQSRWVNTYTDVFTSSALLWKKPSLKTMNFWLFITVSKFLFNFLFNILKCLPLVNLFIIYFVLYYSY